MESNQCGKLLRGELVILLIILYHAYRTIDDVVLALGHVARRLCGLVGVGRRQVYACVEINQCVGCTDKSSLSHLTAMARLSWLGRAARNRHRHAIEQASRR